VPGIDAFPDEGPASWRVPGTPLRIVRMTEGPKQGEFVFGPRTPEVAERFFPRIEHLPLRQETDLPVRSWTHTFPQWTGPMIPAGTAAAMPPLLREFALDTPIWKIIAIGIVTAVLAAGIGLVHWLVAGAGGRSTLAILRRTVTPVLMLAAVAWMGPFLQFQLYPSGAFAAATKVALVLVWYAALVWLAWLAVTALFAWIVRLRGLEDDGFDAHLWRLGGTVIALLVAVVIIGDGATQLGLPVFSVLAGLGIGGLAVALAIRPTLENLIGGIILYTDQPVRVGDFCTFGDKSGTIEAIGVRSTKIRALDRTIITVPNAEFVNLNIENLTRRNQMLLQSRIGFRYETKPDQIRWLLAETRKLLLQHPMVAPEPARARFAGFGNHSVDIEIFAYIKTNDFSEFFSIREDIFLRLIDIVEESGTTFAFPSTINYLARDSGMDGERASRIEAIMRELRNGQKLPFPEFDDKTRKELLDSLDFPPEGSVGSGRRSF
jgi:MscS family membrane protein